MKEWNKLSVKERGAFIKAAVTNGLRDLNDIQNSHLEFIRLYKDGGETGADDVDPATITSSSGGDSYVEYYPWNADSAAYNSNKAIAAKEMLLNNSDARRFINDFHLNTPYESQDEYLDSPFKTFSDLANKVHNGAKHNCLAGALNMLSILATALGKTPLRTLFEKDNFTPAKFPLFSVIERNQKEGGWEESPGWSSWNFAPAASYAGYGHFIDPSADSNFSYSNLPLGTIVSLGSGAADPYPQGPAYIKPEYKYFLGKERPRHSVILTGFDYDEKTRLRLPIFYDYGNIRSADNLIHGNDLPVPLFVFIPRGFEGLTMENVIAAELYIRNQSKVNEDWVRAIIPQNQQKVELEYFNDPGTFANAISNFNNVHRIDTNTSQELLKRLLAIGTQESKLGYNLLGESFEDDWTILREAKMSAPDLYKSLAKFYTRIIPEAFKGITGDYDTKALWLREVELYNKLKELGVFKDKSLEETQSIVNAALHRARELAPNLGKLHIYDDVTNNSHGIFQMKELPPWIAEDKITGEKISYNPDEDYDETLNNEVLKAYNRFAYFYDLLRLKYPDLNTLLLLDAATIGWNGWGKSNNSKFIDFYIRNRNLQDEYLEKVKGWLEKLYPTIYKEGGAIHINPKNKGKFTETKKRSGKTTEELTHSKNPLTRKRAIFVLNAKKWKH